MPQNAFTHLELLAEVDALAAELDAWAGRAPDWPTARQCKALVKRLLERVDTLRIRLDAPLVVATLGGTGTGKSTLVNALVGAEVTQPGRQRPTTRQPTLISRPDLEPTLLGIDPASVQWVKHESPILRDLVLLDCPDPDTTEEADAPGTNLARLRELLPHCDVLLVTTTQQKYRSARVSDELAAAAGGARLVFVQTHADFESDIRDDWRRTLAGHYATGDVFFVDSVAALAAARQGLQPKGEFGRLVDLLTRELAGAAAHRIRRANFLDLVEETLAACHARIDAALPRIEQLEAGITEQRTRLASRLTNRMRDELLGSRRQWENRLLGEVASRWGFSPFSCVLRVYQGLGGFVAGAALTRVRTPAQLALWGAMEGGRRWRSRQKESQAAGATTRAAALGWDEADLRTAAIIVDGYAAEAGLPREETDPAVVEREAAAAGSAFVVDASAQLQSLVRKLAGRHTGWFTRLRYELLFLVMLAAVLYRFGKNFFYDSWLAVELGWSTAPQPVHGLDFFVASGIVLVLWSALLLWAFTSRLRRGLVSEINELMQQWSNPKLAAPIFAGLERQCRAIRNDRGELERLESRVVELGQRVAQPEPLGHKIAEA